MAKYSILVIFVLCFFIVPRISSVPVTIRTGSESQNYSSLNHVSRATCPVEGFSFADSLFKCKSFKDLISLGSTTVTSGLTDLASQTLSDTDLEDINKHFIVPIVQGIQTTFDAAVSSPASPAFLDSNICLGNFIGPDDFDGYEGVCGNLPLKGEWTVMGFAIDIGVGSPFHSACPKVTDPAGTFATFCVAINVDTCNSVPSVAIALTPNLFECHPFDAVLTTSTAGASVAVIKGIDLFVDSYSLGISPTNSFETSFKTFDGDGIVTDFVAPGSVYSAGAFSLSTSTLGLPDFFEIGGDAVKMINIEGVTDGAKQVLAKLQNDPRGSAESAVESISNITFSILYSITLRMKFAFSTLGKLGKALPDSEDFEIGYTSLYATTSSVTSGSDTLKPGVYTYSSASPSSVMTALIEYALTFTEEILNVLPDWAPVDIDLSSIATKIKSSGTSDGDFAVGFATIIPDKKAVIMIKVPLIIDSLGFLEITCEVDIDDESFKCKVKTNFGEKFFAAIGETIANGAIWVAQEIPNFAEDVVKDGKEILAAGLTTVGDAIDGTGSVFSKKTISHTIEHLDELGVDLSPLGDLGPAVQAWGKKNGKKIQNVVEDIEDGLVNGIRETGHFGSEVIHDLEQLFFLDEKDLEDAAKAVAAVLGCTNDGTRKAIDIGCKSCCSKAYAIAQDLVKTSRNVAKTVENVIEDVGEVIIEGFEDILSAVGVYKTKSTLVIEATSRYDSITNCQIFEYYNKEDKYIDVGLGKIKVGTENVHLYNAPKEECVTAHTQKVLTAMEADDVKDASETKLAQTKTQMTPSFTAESIDLATLENNGLKCTTEMDVAAGSFTTFKYPLVTLRVFTVPTTITCTTPKIQADGTISGSYSSVTTGKVYVHESDVSQTDSSFANLEDLAKENLLKLITEDVITS